MEDFFGKGQYVWVKSRKHDAHNQYTTGRWPRESNILHFALIISIGSSDPLLDHHHHYLDQDHRTKLLFSLQFEDQPLNLDRTRGKEERNQRKRVHVVF